MKTYSGINDLCSAHAQANRDSKELVLIYETATSFQFDFNGEVHAYVKPDYANKIDGLTVALYNSNDLLGRIMNDDVDTDTVVEQIKYNESKLNLDSPKD